MKAVAHRMQGPTDAWDLQVHAPPAPSPPARTQVLTSSGLPAAQIKHLAGGVYGWANSGLPMVSWGRRTRQRRGAGTAAQQSRAS